jgi:predicted DNA-binding transcriptional regulator
LNRDRAIGTILLMGSVIAIIVYGWLLYGFPIIVLQITAFVVVAGVLAILAWIGWTLATTLPPTEMKTDDRGDPARRENERAE